MWAQQVGCRIEQLRRERDLTRAQFGKMVNLSEQYVGRLEHGRHSLTGSAIAKICTATGVSADYIIFGTNNFTEAVNALEGLSQEQIVICLDLLKRLAQLINTDTGNNMLIQEVLRQQQSRGLSQ